MTAARQLDPQPQREPTVTEDDLGLLGLPPLPANPDRMTIAAHAASQHSAEIPHSVAMKRIDQASHKVLILFIVGLIAFAGGVGVATAVVTGAVDLESGWVKDAIGLLKQAAKIVLNK